MIKDFGKYAIIFVVLVLIQVLILNNIQLSGFVNPYIYVLFVLLLPFNTPGYMLLLLSFFLGLSVDVFNNTPGLHAGASVFLGFLRPGIAELISSREVIEKGNSPTMKHLGFASFFKYTIIAVFAHHLFLFYAEAFSFDGFLQTLLRCILSTVFSVVLLLASQFILFKNID